MLQHKEAKLESYSSVADKSRSRRESEDESEIGWSVINEEVDTVIPLLLEHLQKLQIEHLQLPDIKENLAVVSIKKPLHDVPRQPSQVPHISNYLFQKPLFITYEAGLYLTNGIVYNVAGIERYGPAYMTYRDKSFLIRFYLNIKNLQVS